MSKRSTRAATPAARSTARAASPSAGPTDRLGDARATLHASAVLERQSKERQEALIAHLPAPIRVPGEQRAFDLSALPDGAFALFAADSRVLFFVERSRPAPAPEPQAAAPRRRRGPPPGQEGVPTATPDAGEDDWMAGAPREDGTSAISTVPTLFGGTAIFPVVGRHLRLRTQMPSAYYVITPEILDALARDPAWGRGAVHAMVNLLFIDSVLATAPATRRSAGRQRCIIAESMSRIQVKAGQRLVELEAPSEALYVVAGEGHVEFTRRSPGGEVTYTLGYGAVFGGEALDPSRAHPSLVGAAAHEATELLVLPRARIHDLLTSSSQVSGTGSDWFRLFATSFREIDRSAPGLVADLRNLPVLGSLAASDLYALLQGTDLLRWRLNWPDPEPINQVPGFGIVLDGELLRVGSRDGPHARESDHALYPECAVRPGEAFGLQDMVLGEPVGPVWQARTPARVVFFLRHRCLEVLDRVNLFLSRVIEARQVAAQQGAARHRLEAGGHARARVVLFQPVGTGAVAPHLPALLDGLAGAILADFAEPCVVVKLDRPEVSTLEAAVAEARRDPKVRWVLVSAPEAPTLWPLFDRVVLTHSDRCIPFSAPSPRLVPSVFTTILPVDVPVQDANSPPSRNVYPPNRVRMTMPLAGGARTGEAWRTAFPADFSRWGRAVTDRRVGVALGGGGAWGFAHLAVLYHMELQGIPVDMVSGASFGAVVGAFYAAEQREGLMKLLKHGKALNRATKIAFVTYVPMQRLLDKILGGRRIEDLVIPYFPATTDVVSGSEDYVSRGTLGQGVRASGGLSPMMPPTRNGFATWVDGGMVANVPAGVLRQEGARFVVSSNVVPPPEMPPEAPLFPRWYGQVLADLNPLARMEAAVASWMTAMATIGEYSASQADVQFDAAQPRSLPMNMEGGLPILTNAVSNPAFWDALKAARDHWTRLGGRPG